MEFPMRINKYLAHRGLASRREADTLITRGLVKINNKPATIGQQVHADDTVTVDQSKQTKKRYFAYYKGRGIITHSPTEEETDIVTKLATDYGLQDIYPIGRLDKASEGLILLSDDGRITGPLLDPEHGHEREYEVTVDKPVNHWFIKHMGTGVDIEGYITKPADVEVNKRNPKRFTLILTEGKKHQIRRMCAALGYQVIRLKRIRIAHITLDELKPNQYRKLSSAERTKLLQALQIENQSQ